jgi:hypothetical protein
LLARLVLCLVFMPRPWEMRRDTRRRPRLEKREGAWYLDGRPVRPGDLVEVRRARVGEEEVGDDWVPAVVGCDGKAVELEDPSDFVPGSRSGSMRAAGLRTLQLDHAEIRRVQMGVPQQRPATKDCEPDIERAEAEGMVTEDAKISATTPDDEAH